MVKPIPKNAEMRELKRQLPFASGPNDATNSSIEDPDTTLTMIVLLVACLALAFLADLVV